MNSFPDSFKTRASQRVSLSIKAALAGWLAFFMVCLALCTFGAISRPQAAENPFAILLLYGLYSGVVVFAVWLVVELPLALFIPDRAFFWKPEVLAITGIVSGILVVCGFQFYAFKSNPTIQVNDWSAYLAGDILLPCLPAMFVGGVTGAVAGCLY